MREIINQRFDKNYFLKFEQDKSRREWHLFYQEQISEIQSILGDKIQICDIGCGLGYFLELCDRAGWSTFGIDVSEYAIQEAKKRTKAMLEVSNVGDKIPFDQEFDAITCFDVIEHLESPENALININRKLRAGGIFLLTTPNLKSKISKRISSWQEDETHISIKPHTEWKMILESIGFRIISIKTIFPLLENNSGLKGLVGKILARIGFGSTLNILASKPTENSKI